MKITPSLQSVDNKLADLVYELICIKNVEEQM